MGENVIKLDFTSPILTSGSAITRYIDKEDGAEYIYSLFVPSDASTAFPVFDQPDLKARFELNVLAPKEWKIVSNDFLKYEHECFIPIHSNEKIHCPIPDGMQDIGFAETKPISTYVFAFAAGPWERVSDAGVGSPHVSKGGTPAGVNVGPPTRTQSTDSVAPSLTVGRPTRSADPKESTVPGEVFVRKSQLGKYKPHAEEVVRLRDAAIQHLETYFDYKFPFPKYDIVLIPEFPFGGMEHAGATFLRESSVIFPTEPTANDYISRANLIFHETAHQWFGDTVTMRWFDDLWLKEGFAEFMAYKTLEKVMPQYNAWKVFYERNKQAAYLTDSTRGTTPIYQPIDNLSSAKSAYGNIVYRKAPSFLRQAEFYLGPDKFQTAVRAFLKKHEYANAGWEDLVKEFEVASGQDLKEWASIWVKKPGLPIFRVVNNPYKIFGDIIYLPGSPPPPKNSEISVDSYRDIEQKESLGNDGLWPSSLNILVRDKAGLNRIQRIRFGKNESKTSIYEDDSEGIDAFVRALNKSGPPAFIFPNYQDYGYGIFLLDDKSRDYVLKNIQNEKDDFLRTMMWGSLWDSVREAELDPKEYVELVIKNIATEKDEGTIQTLLGRVSTAMNYYIDSPPMQKPAREQGFNEQLPGQALANARASAPGADLQTRLENMLIERMQNAPTLGQRITYYRAFLNNVSTERSRQVLSEILNLKFQIPNFKLKTKDRFDIVTRLAILGDAEAPKLLADLEKTETSDDAKRYAYAAHAAFATKENREKFWIDFINNKEISENWIEAAIGPFNSIRHSDLSLPFLQRALAELPNLKRTRKIFFVNGWLSAFIGGQRSEQALAIVNKFLADNPGLDRDLRLKILENVDLIERAVKIRAKYVNN